jgi:hypothetical protein
MQSAIIIQAAAMHLSIAQRTYLLLKLCARLQQQLALPLHAFQLRIQPINFTVNALQLALQLHGVVHAPLLAARRTLPVGHDALYALGV